MKYVLIGFLKAYRLVISPLYGDVCRYYPSCSAYALRAVQYHGAVKGTWYAARRLLRCHPWAAGGYDPVLGTPEFDEEMRVLRETAATIEHASVLDQSERLAQRGTLDHVPHGHRPQGEAAMVARAQGGN